MGTLASVVLSSTAFSWTRALRARAWAPNFRACLRQVWSSETESSEGTWGHRHCQFCKFRTPLPTTHPQSSLLTLPRCGRTETVVLFVRLTGDGQTGEPGSAGGLGSAGELGSAEELGQESWRLRRHRINWGCEGVPAPCGARTRVSVHSTRRAGVRR